jgi:hypothetical protein
LEEPEEVIGGSITQRIVAARLIETGPQQTGLAEPLAGTRWPIGRPVPGTRSGDRAVTWPPTPAELAGATVSVEQAASVGPAIAVGSGEQEASVEPAIAEA